MKSEIVIKDGRVYHLGLAKGEVSTRIILVGDPARADLVASKFETIELIRKNREYVTITGNYQGERLSVIGTGMSTDNIEILLAELYTVFAFDWESKTKLSEVPPVSLIRVGTSGGVQRDLEDGILAISEYALGLDSTGLYFESPSSDILTALETSCRQILAAHTPKHYRFSGQLPVYASQASPNLFNRLKEEALGRNANIATGITATTPGFYGPSARYIEGIVNTVEDIKHHLAGLQVTGLRVINMDMESSLLFHLGALLNFECCTICPIISGPASPDKPIDYSKAVDQAIDIALDSLV